MTKQNCEKDIKLLEGKISEWTAVDTVLMEKRVDDDKVAHLTLVNNYGSKIAAIIEWVKLIIKNDCNKSCVIFFSKVCDTWICKQSTDT